MLVDHADSYAGASAQSYRNPSARAIFQADLHQMDPALRPCDPAAACKKANATKMGPGPARLNFVRPTELDDLSRKSE